MRITDIYLKNYRAFYGDHHISLDKDGKNLMLYGENGSGKSSLFTGLKDFFLSSVQPLKEVEENIFIPIAQKNSAYIKVSVYNPIPPARSIPFELNAIQKEIVNADKVLISDANKIKGFFDYRSLLRTHHEHKEQVDLFKIIVSEVLYHSINRFSNQEIGKEWDTIHRDTWTKKQTKRQQNLTKDYLQNKFNPGLKEILQSIEKDTNTFIKYFGINVNIKLEFDKVEYYGRRMLKGHKINLVIDFYKKEVRKHQFFLNEARLTALAISLYLASIKVNPTKGALKILVLDDLLIGLDMSNRLPLLDILKNHFLEVKADDRFQVIMTTYDKVWYELVKAYFGSDSWKFIEVYSKHLNDEDFEIPIVKIDAGYLATAKKYLDEKDYKASAVYIRTEFERIVKTLCDKKALQVNYKTRQKDFTTEDFWDAITNQTDIQPELAKEIEIHRGTVMNPFSHYDLERPEFKKELEDTIKTVEKLGQLLVDANLKALKKRTYNDLLKEIKKLELQLKKREIGKIIYSLLHKKV